MGGILVILIHCIIFLSPFLDVTRISISTASFLAQLSIFQNKFLITDRRFLKLFWIFYSEIALIHQSPIKKQSPPPKKWLEIVRKGVPIPPPPLTQVDPLLKSLFPLSVPPPFKVFWTVPPTLKQPPTAQIRPTNLSWFKQISKGRFYQFNCHFLSKINFQYFKSFYK